MHGQAPQEWPHALLLLGDQVYADEVHPHIEPHLDGDGEVVTFDDYVRLYCASWGEPVIRWLLSTVPSAMIFDDHDVHDDWNTSIEWVTEMRKKEWWRKRIVAAFESYFIYQHLGNLSPAELDDSEHLRQAAHRWTTRRRCCASSRAAPTSRSRARAGASAARSATRSS